MRVNLVQGAVVARLRNCQPQGRLPPGVTNVGLLQSVFAVIQDEIKPRSYQIYSSGGAFSPCLRAFCDDTAFPAAVFGPVAFRVIPSISRKWDDVDGTRLLDLAVLPRQETQASF